MNDDQRDKMLRTLADAFDRAAISCVLKEQAAEKIEKALRAKGYIITMRRQK